MSVQITITNPASTEPAEIQAVVDYLIGFLCPGSVTVTVLPEEKEAVLDQTPAYAEAPATIVPPPPPPAPEAAAVFAPPVGTVADIQFTPPAVPVPPAPTFNLTPSPAVDVDKDGVPWDGRIHASTKTKTVEGVWKRKRGVDPELVTEVMAELRMTMMAPAAIPVPPAPPVEAAAVPVPPAPPTSLTFPSFMEHVTAGVTSQRFTREKVNEACLAHGVSNLPGLYSRPDLIPAVARELGLIA